MIMNTSQKKEEEKEKNKIKTLANYWQDAVLNNKKKILLVVGAGCSAEAGIKTSQEIIEDFNFGFSDEQIRSILRKRNLEIPFDYIPMEAYFSAYQDILGPAWTKDIYQMIRKHFPARDMILENRKPSLSYALIAHLMKYDFIHSIISLNFDELLEQALVDSLGKNGFQVIASRSEFGRIKDLKLYNQSKIIYKPHGTISRPMTLRDTWDQVNRLDDEKIYVINEVLKTHHIWIFTGYRFGDLDIAPLFLYALKRNENSKIDIWFINRDKSNRLLGKDKDKDQNKDDGKNNGNDSEKEKILDNRLELLLNKSSTDNSTKRFIKCETSYFFRKLIKYLFVLDSSNSTTKIQGTTQDEKKNKMRFYRKGSGYRILDILYNHGLEPTLENRIIYRILLFALITKGKFVDSSLMQVNEIRNLLYIRKKLYRHNKHISDLDINEILSEKLRSFVDKFRQFFCSKKIGFNTVYYLKNEFSETSNFPLSQLSQSSKENNIGKFEEQLFQKLTEFLVNQLPYPEKNKLNSNIKVKEKLELLLKELWQDSDILIRHQPDLLPYIIENQYSKLIITLKELLEKTEKILSDAQELLIVAETGEWLLQNESLLKNKTLRLIISDPQCDYEKSFHRTKVREVENKLKEVELKHLEIKYLPFFENSRHMTLSKSKDKEEGIFFVREAKSLFINPIYVQGKDYKKLYSFFQMLWKNRSYSMSCTTRHCT